MRQFMKKASLPVVVIDGKRLTDEDVLVGDHYAKYVPQLLVEVFPASVEAEEAKPVEAAKKSVKKVEAKAEPVAAPVVEVKVEPVAVPVVEVKAEVVPEPVKVEVAPAAEAAPVAAPVEVKQEEPVKVVVVAEEAKADAKV